MSEIKPRTASVVIYQGDDLAMLEELDEQVERTEREAKRAQKSTESGAVRLLCDETPESARDAARAERDEFATEAEKRAVTVVLHAVGRLKWRELTKANPPRTDAEGDTIPEDHLGVNIETFMDALVPRSILSGIDGDVGDFLDSLTDFDYERLFTAAFRLNRVAPGADPTQRLASASR